MTLIKTIRCTIEYGAGYRGRQFENVPFTGIRNRIKNMADDGMRTISISIRRAMAPEGQENWVFPSQQDGYREFGNCHVVNHVKR